MVAALFCFLYVFGMEYKENQKHLSIKEWATGDRPREKMLEMGAAALSDAELLAILIGSGNAQESAVDLSRRILQDCQNDLYMLGRQDIRALMNYKGIGEAKAITIAAALELGKRRKNADISHNLQITSSNDIYNCFYAQMVDLPYEEFWLLLLNNSLRIIKKVKIGQGGISETTVDIRLIMKTAVLHLASAMVVCHNHPSGNLSPSRQDDLLTEKIRNAASLFQIRLIDHLIIGPNSYYSYSDEGKI